MICSLFLCLSNSQLLSIGKYATATFKLSCAQTLVKINLKSCSFYIRNRLEKNSNSLTRQTIENGVFILVSSTNCVSSEMAAKPKIDYVKEKERSDGKTDSLSATMRPISRWLTAGHQQKLLVHVWVTLSFPFWYFKPLIMSQFMKQTNGLTWNERSVSDSHTKTCESFRLHSNQTQHVSHFRVGGEIYRLRHGNLTWSLILKIDVTDKITPQFAY